jgi:hypothetical protein
MARQLSAKAILPDQISLEHCDWYSDDAPAGHNTGALKLPRGNTSERPTTATGGRENVELIATTSQPNTLSSDAGFLANDPWIWAWDGNYNRNMLTATTVASGNALPGFTLLRGSTYRFRNGTVGHNLWLRSAEKTSSGQANNIFALGASDGVTNNGAIRADSSAASTTTTWEIPSNYSGTQVFIQHNQTGMVNTIPIADPPDETLGYIRLNTDIGHDESTQTGLELYTGTGWKTIPFADNAGGTKTHPVGTLLTDDNGLLTGSVASTDDAGALTGSVASTDNFEDIVLTAFLADGDISQTSTGVNATKTLAIHDGATGGGIQMLRNDLANLSTSMVNQSIQLMNIADQSPNAMSVAGSNGSRVTLTETLVGHDVFTLEDGGNRLRCTKDVPSNINFKVEAKIHANASYRFELWKNGVRQTGSDHYTLINIHNTMTSYTTVSFNDVLEFRCHSYNSTVDTINISGSGFISLQLIGS